MNDLRELYEEVILDHNRNPRNYPKVPDGHNHDAHGYNPLCGDDLHLYLTVRDGIIADAGFEGSGCAISTASASLMTEALIGLPVGQADQLFQDVHDMLTDQDQDGEPAETLGKLAVLGGVKTYPMRVKCASLAWHTMNAALHGADEAVSTE
jgi:nitrogen fixation protein NifU and related proteins